MRKMIYTLLACLSLVGCGKKEEKDKATAQAKIAVFHEQFNNQNFNAMLGEAHPEMLETFSYTTLFSKMHRNLGKVASSETVDWHTVRRKDAVRFVIFVQDTMFEEGKGQEKFTFIIQKKNFALLGYTITPEGPILE